MRSAHTYLYEPFCFRVAIAKSYIEDFNKIEIFNQEETATLIKMLDSTDYDNADLAIELIKTRLNGNSI